MTTDDVKDTASLDRLNDNLAKLEELSQRLLDAMARKRNIDPSLQGPGQDLMMKAGTAYMSEMMQHPSKIFEQQVSYWGKTLQHFIEAQEALAAGKLEPPEDRTPKDPRFADERWETHPYFNFVKQQYLMSAQAIEAAARKIEGLNDRDRQRLSYFTRQIVDMMSPANFLGTNPEALARAVETDGASLVQGLENLVSDIEAHNGELMVTLADKSAFRVGENLASTPGKVVFRNRMFELIQYAPTTETVHATPLIIFPPWINKFFILDLKPKNSLIKWIVDQGYTLFVVSWVNPDASYADVGMETYVEEGFLTAIEQVKAITGQSKVNAVGYCIAGTTLSIVLGLMAQAGDKSVKSATFFTTLTDFTDPGEVGVFLNDDFLEAIEREVAGQGILSAYFIARTFSFLRANDLIYRPAIRSYMMGEAPPAFDLLYWNGDGTNLPARMAVEYLRKLCQANELARGVFQILGRTPKLSDIKIPLCAIACETDHIAGWKSSFKGISQMGSKDKTFILSESGHVAGVVNPPTKNKYGHYTSDAPIEEADAWKESAEFHQGSWWPRWGAWLKTRSGKQVPAREPRPVGNEDLGAAPGTYVVAK